MAITGKYDFLGIKKAGLAALKVALASTSWGASLVANGFFKFATPLIDVMLEAGVNFLANNGLILLNLGAILVDGKVDQARLDSAIEKGLARVLKGRETITEAEGKAIDDEVIDAADQFIDFGAAPDADGSVRRDADPGLQGGSDPSI